MIRRLIERFVNLFWPRLDIGNRAEINRRIRAIQGIDPTECRALMVIGRDK